MFWAFVCAIGFLLGFVFRVPAVLALGALLFAANLAADVMQGADWSTALLLSFLMLVALEGSYLVGLGAALVLSRRSRRKSP